MLRTLRLLCGAALFATATPAIAGPGSLDAQVLLVRPNQSGKMPKELAPMKKALTSKGYTGAAVDARKSVHLERNQTEHVRVGAMEVDLTLLSVDDGRAKVRVAPEGHAAKVTSVSTRDTRFFLTVPKKRR